MNIRNETIVRSKKSQLSAKEILELAVTSLDDDKGKDIVTIDLAGKSSLADHLVIVSGTSQRQVVAMADHLMEKLKAAGLKGLMAEGKDQGDWVVVDAFDVIIHLFRPEVREFYNLEKMWDGPASASADSEHIS
ncbi:ribosome silencing factor [Terasakiella sp. A23]|uniref:ribosome silencing factor n=1 Tax=Terasakiella sp. FCG-A23 TaxID=3080561 RepID=UPI002953B1C6|nr:ribosome silencing factor [Terasakiella sp. A23]MDV7338167.1 ribosome silencing factor [Terasakiella sp. A23]